MEAAAEVALHLDDRLARYEPLALVAAPLLALLVARLVHAAASAVADWGLVAIAAIKSAPSPLSRVHSSLLPCCLIPHAVTPVCWHALASIA